MKYIKNLTNSPKTPSLSRAEKISNKNKRVFGFVGKITPSSVGVQLGTFAACHSLSLSLYIFLSSLTYLVKA